MEQFLDAVEGREAQFLTMERDAKKDALMSRFNESNELSDDNLLKEIFVESTNKVKEGKNDGLE